MRVNAKKLKKAHEGASRGFQMFGGTQGGRRASMGKLDVNRT